MAHEIKNVALAGASGSLGSHILQALVKAGRFNVTILTRKVTDNLPSGTAVKVVDYESASDLVSALKGQDALVDATSVPDPSLAIRLIDAAVSAGVYRIIPSEFSSDPMNSKARSLPPFQGKAKVLEYIQKLADTGKITWTAISNHAFLDWGLRMSFLGIDLQNKNVEYLKPGTTIIPMTTLKPVGTAVANALIKGENTKNRICYICSTQKTQKDLAELSKQALGEEGWKSMNVDTEDAFNKAMAKLQAGQVDMQVIGDIIRFSISTPGYIDRLEKTDNDLLGVKTMSDEEVKELILEIAREKTIA
ncbi:isoflavone reductase family protein [Fusarium oxysporum f. sp. phaseoli]